MRVFWLFLLLFMTQGVSFAMIPYDINSPEVKEIASKFSMQGHSEHDLATCSTKQRYYEDIVELLNEGKTKQEILDYYFSMYGEEGLRAPKKEGFSLLAWITPFFVLTIGGVGVGIGVRNLINNREDIKFVEKEHNSEEVETELMTLLINEERKKYL